MPVDLTLRTEKGSKLTFDELDDNFRNIADALDSGGLSSNLAQNKVYIGNSLNVAEQQTLNTNLVPETANKNYQSDNQKLFNDATSSIQTQLDGKQGNLGYTPLNSALNLSDLANVSQALSNLGLGSLATKSTINNSDWSGTALADSNIASASNWNTAFSNRITSLTTTGSSGSATLISNVLNIPTYTLAGLGGQPLATNLTSLSALTFASTSFVKMTSAGTFALDTATYYSSANPEVETEIWSTNANYTISNITSKVLVLQQTGTLSAARTITLSVLPAGSILVIQGGASITSTNVVNIAGFVNGISSFSSALTLPYQSLILYSQGGGNYTTNKPQFIDTTTSLSTTKILRGNVLGTDAQDGYPTLSNAGDFKNIRLNSFAFGVAMLMRGFAATQILKAYDARTGWTHWANTGANPNLCYWDGQEITSGLFPASGLGGNIANNYVGYYSYIINDSVGRSIRGYFFVNSSGVPSSLIQTQQETSGLSIAITGSPAKVVVTNTNAIYARITPLETNTALSKMPELNQSWSNDGTTSYWNGSLGVGHTSINASAQFQVDSTTKGSLCLPRVTNSQKTSISSPANGLGVYDSDLGTPSFYTTINSINAWIDTKVKYSELFDPFLIDQQVSSAGTCYVARFKPKADMIITAIEFLVTAFGSTETFYCGVYSSALTTKITDGSLSVTSGGEKQCTVTKARLIGGTTYYVVLKDNAGGTNSVGASTSYSNTLICSSKFIGSGALPADLTSGGSPTADTKAPYMAVISL